MTITEVLNQIHVKYEFNVEYFDMTNEDQLVRLALVNDKINMWENEDGILWRELFTSVQDRFTDEATYPVEDLILPAGTHFYNHRYQDI